MMASVTKLTASLHCAFRAELDYSIAWEADHHYNPTSAAALPINPTLLAHSDIHPLVLVLLLCSCSGRLELEVIVAVLLLPLLILIQPCLRSLTWTIPSQ